MSRIFYNAEYFKKHPRYGMLTVIGFRKMKRWGQLLGICDCLCDCGKKVTITNQSLRTGHTQSCGCKRFIGKRENHQSFKGYGEISGVFFNRIRDNARKRKHKFKITIQELWNLFLKQNRKCALTNLPLTFNTTNFVSDGNASLDRINNSKDYIKGNVQWVLKEINMMKHKHSQSHFIELCQRVIEANVKSEPSDLARSSS